MFNHSDFNTKKYIILMSVICIVFFVIVIKAFEYLPIKDENAIASRHNLEKINTTRQTQEQTEQNDAVSKDDIRHKHVHIDLMKTPKKENIEEKIEEIQAPEGVGYEETEVSKVKSENNSEKSLELSSEDKAKLALYKGQSNFINKQYTEAMQDFQSAIQLTKDSNLTASAYEGISHVYAANKKYGTALTFATKAYSLSPSSSREMLLARLYYKTGDIEKATKRINNILHRDFTNN